MRRWAAQISFVATQEMLHLAQVWNLLQAIGGTPYHLHPLFPLPRGGLPIRVTMSLECFSLATVRRFVAWELPMRRQQIEGPDDAYSTVGELYDHIARLIEVLPEPSLFITDPKLQIGPDLGDFPDLRPVRDRASARAAIDAIRAQGEGSIEDRDDCHYGIFRGIEHELERTLAADPSFAPAVSAIANPVRRLQSDATLVTDPATLRVMEVFDDLYGLAIRVLAWVFGAARPSDPRTRACSMFAVAIMPVVLRPLGEILMRLPSGIEDLGAGPAFLLSRHVPLPESPSVALQLIRERIDDLAADLEALGGEPRIPPATAASIGVLARSLREVARPLHV